MPLCNLKELLNDAKKKKYGVFAIDVFNFDNAEAVIKAAEEKKSPVIIMVCDDLFKFFNFDKLMSPIISMINDATVRIVLHLDHCSNFQVIMRSIKAGVSSVMFDGSMLPLDENMKITKEIVNISHALDISVEGEIGIIGGREGGFDYRNKTINSDNFTKVEQAVKFTDETGVDALAISVGTIHGVYKGKFDIDFNRISKIRDAVETPLVLHGGSGCTDDDFRKAVENGITKINYYTNLILDANNKLKEIVDSSKDLNYVNINYDIMKTIKEKIKEKMDIVSSTGKY